MEEKDELFAVKLPHEYWFVVAIDLLVRSKKSRVFDWACHVYPHEIHGTLRKYTWYLDMLDEKLKEKDFKGALSCVQHIYYISVQNEERKKENKELKKKNKDVKHKEILITNEEFQMLKKRYKVPPIVNKYDNVAAQAWLPILGFIHTEKTFEPEDPRLRQCQCLQLLTDRLYNLALKRNDRLMFRYQHSSKLFLMHAIYAICYPKEVVRTWYKDNNIDLHKELLDENEIVEVISILKSGKGLVGVPEHAMDKHTAWGQGLKRKMEHFIIHGARLTNNPPHLRRLEMDLLEMAVEEMKEERDLKSSFEIPENYLTTLPPEEERYPIPKIPELWDTIMNPRNQMQNKTQRGLHYFLCHEASSAMQKAVRRCQNEAFQWGLENFWTGKAWRTNVMKRCLIMCSEDIGPANLSLILLVEDILDKVIESIR